MKIDNNNNGSKTKTNPKINNHWYFFSMVLKLILGKLMFELLFHRKMPIPTATIPQAIEIEVKKSWLLKEKISTNK
jgi:hypothetical protein